MDVATDRHPRRATPAERLVARPRPHDPGPESAQAAAAELVDAAARLATLPRSPAAAALVVALVGEVRSPEAAVDADARFAAAVVDAAGAVYWCRTVRHPVGDCAFGPRSAQRCGLVLEAAHELAHA